jgi:quercetin dioxygenase-like cupin family protein
MRTSILFGVMLACGLAHSPAMAQAPVPGRPEVVLQEVVSGMPRGARQEVRVLTATLKPGDRTPLHTHRFPVTVYVLEGTFTLEVEGRAPTILRAGQAMVEPPSVKMTGYNRSATESMRVVIVYVSDPDTPFLDVSQ